MSGKFSINLVAFDLFGVIFKEGHIVSNALMPLLPDTIKKSQVKRFYNLLTLGHISESTFWQGIGQAGNDKLRKRFLDSFLLDEAYNKVVNQLNTHYSLAILSNLASEWASYLTNKHHFERHFSPIIISGEVACSKPDKKIAEILINHSKTQPEHIIFIDDRLENLASAHKLGMQTVHYARETDDVDFKADYRIHKLDDILDFL